MTDIKDLRRRVKKIIDTADDTTVKMVHAMLEVKLENDWWDELPPSARKEIDEAIKEIDTGKGISHEQIMKTYPQWFTK